MKNSTIKKLIRRPIVILLFPVALPLYLLLWAGEKGEQGFVDFCLEVAPW